MRVCDLRSDSDLDSIRNSCDVSLPSNIIIVVDAVVIAFVAFSSHYLIIKNNNITIWARFPFSETEGKFVHIFKIEDTRNTKWVREF